MRPLIVSLLFAFISLPAIGGEMFVVKTKADADVVVYVTNYKWEAHLVVGMTDVSLFARNNDWYWKFVNYKTNQTIKVYFTKWKYEADVIIYYSSINRGWKKSNKFQGRLH